MNGTAVAGGVVLAICAVLTVIGGLVAWLFKRHDRAEDRGSHDSSAREAKLNAWHNELLAREQLFSARQEEFQARIDRHLAEQDLKISELEREIEKYRVAVPLLAARVAYHDPDDPVLAQVSTLLGATFPLTTADLDGAMRDLLTKMP